MEKVLEHDELFVSEYDDEKIWLKYCGFLDFSLDDFMIIQKSLLRDQIAIKLENISLYNNAIQMRHHLQVLSRRLVEIQEGLSNVARHAKARLSISARTGALHIIVRDQGVGFDPAKVNSNSTGLMGMRERIVRVGGSMRIDSFTGKGARLEIALPLSERSTNGS